MEVQAAGGGQQAVRLLQAGRQEGQEVVEDIQVPLGTDLDGLVALALEADPVALVAALGADLGARLGFAGIKWRIDVDQIDRFREAWIAE